MWEEGSPLAEIRKDAYGYVAWLVLGLAVAMFVVGGLRDALLPEEADYWLLGATVIAITAWAGRRIAMQGRLTAAAVLLLGGTILGIDTALLLPGVSPAVFSAFLLLVISLSGLLMNRWSVPIVTGACLLNAVLVVGLAHGFHHDTVFPLLVLSGLALLTSGIVSGQHDLFLSAVDWAVDSEKKARTRRDELFVSEQSLQKVNLVLEATKRQLHQAQTELEAINNELEARVAWRTAELQESETRYRALFQEAQANLARTQTLYEAARLLNVISPLREVLQTIVNHIAGVLSANAVALVMLDEARERIIYFVTGGPDATQAEVISYQELQEGLSGWAIRQRQVALSPKAMPDPRESPAVQARRQRAGTGAVIVTPIIHRQKLLGTITALNRLEQPDFNQEDLDMLSALADQVAVAIENTRLFQAIQSFVPHEFLRLLGRESIVDVQLGDQVEAEMTVLFADVRGFSTLAETMSPKESFDFINHLLGGLGPLIRHYQGFIDKYMGDGIMALFLHANDAVEAAKAIQQQLAIYDQQNHMRGRPAVRLGIGLHTGPLMLGTIGESERMETTVIADAVNTAARMESLTKEYDIDIIVSEATHRLVNAQPDWPSHFLGFVPVRGRQQPVAVYGIRSQASESTQSTI